MKWHTPRPERRPISRYNTIKKSNKRPLFDVIVGSFEVVSKEAIALCMRVFGEVEEGRVVDRFTR
jgi:hypothetical protein